MAASNGGGLPVVDLAPFFAGEGADDAGARARAPRPCARRARPPASAWACRRASSQSTTPTALRYFPATSSDENNGISAHEDGNCITFVLQDGVGGLEVLGEDGRWVPAEPVEGSIVVNVGDVLQVTYGFIVG
uniref:Isopenicillin N synthase-like Fe(2+) 2OG dioxygenase domain-containing protein n=1 Tax=Aegilops tauschii TaxID=37682 RepID=M8ALS5_AEGTA